MKNSAETGMMNRAEDPVLFFDGVCNLCNASVDFVLRHDPQQLFRFASLQSPAARRLLSPYGLPVETLHSVVLLQDGQLYVQSEAAWRVVQQLSGLWSVLSVVRWLPRSWRDAVYTGIARYRYRVFGKREICRVSDDRYADRFIPE